MSNKKITETSPAHEVSLIFPGQRLCARANASLDPGHGWGRFEVAAGDWSSLHWDEIWTPLLPRAPAARIGAMRTYDFAVRNPAQLGG